MNHINAAGLSSCDVSADGARVQIGFHEEGGESSSLSLPSHCLNQLIMTLPGLLRRALWNRYRDSSLRLVFPLAKLKIEQAVGKNSLIITSATSDGFEVSFEYSQQQLDAFAGAVIDVESTLTNASELARRLD